MTDEEIVQIASAELQKQYESQQWGVKKQWGDTFCMHFGDSKIYAYLYWSDGVYVYLSTNNELDFWSHEHEDDFFDAIYNSVGITDWIKGNI